MLSVLRGGRVQGSRTPECLSKAVKKLATRISTSDRELTQALERATEPLPSAETAATLF
jgi:rRNA-processing protein FCF1